MSIDFQGRVAIVTGAGGGLGKQHALALAKQALFITTPNPRVGCVITSSNGEVLGEGYTQAAGLAHAEIEALADARKYGVEWLLQDGDKFYSQKGLVK